MSAIHLYIAEDDPDTQFILETYWVNLGHRVTMFGDGQALLDGLQAGPTLPDLVMLDMMMPIRDGLSTAQALRANRATGGLPIVCLSAKAEQVAVSPEASLFDAIIAKPIMLRAMGEQVLRAWAERRDGHGLA